MPYPTAGGAGRRNRISSPPTGPCLERARNKKEGWNGRGSVSVVKPAYLAMIPNFLGFTRMGLAPVVLWLVLTGDFKSAFWVFAIAGLTDAFDGIAARRLGVTSEFGQLLDPLADKILMNMTFIALAVIAMIPVWLAGLVLLRDVILAAGVAVARIRHAQVPLAPLRISKTNTGLQIFLAAMVLAVAAYGWPLEGYVLPLAVAVAGLTVASGVIYLYRLVQDRKK